MKRIDYRLTPSERRLGIDLAALVAPSLRGPLAILACALGMTVVVASVEDARLRAAVHDGAQDQRRLAAVELVLARARAAERDVARLRALETEAAAFRRSGDAEASRIASLGNRIPAGAWLTSLRADRGALQLEGGGVGVGLVAAALSALAQLPAYGEPRLLSLHESPLHHGVTYALSLEAAR